MSGAAEVVDVEVVTADGLVVADEVEVDAGDVAPGGSASVQYVPSGWALVTYSTGEAEPTSYSVSVSPDGLIRLPHSLPPELGQAFVGAVAAAAEVGSALQAAALNAPKRSSRGIRDSSDLVSYINNIVISEGKPPAGAVRLPTSSAPTQGRR